MIPVPSGVRVWLAGGVTGAARFNSWGKPEAVAGTAEGIAKALPEGAWARLSAGEGTKGPRAFDWAYLELADLDPADVGAPPGLGTWTRGLLVRRRPGDGELAFFSTWCPVGTGIEALVRVEGRRWAIEDAFETAKTELGLCHDETRSWHGWHRHVSLVMLAFALLAVVRHECDALSAPPKEDEERSRAMVRWSMQEIRRVAGRLAQRRIEPAFVIAWSAWRRCHQAVAREAHLKRRPQL